ncbi:hypothetical protein AAVH_23363 [Aphelenchoides avenae]|nr:hypothetical protein AAVH_23363 [Aphelenchus avenae]
MTRLSCFLVGENPSKWTAWVDATLRIAKNHGGFGEEASFRRKLLGKEPLADAWGWNEFLTVAVVCGASFNVFEIVGAFGADVKLKVGDSIFYTNKGYLSVVSSVFRDTFALMDATASNIELEEIELKDLNAGAFEEFLGVIYPTRYPITGKLRSTDFPFRMWLANECFLDANVVSLFRIADRYNGFVDRQVDHPIETRAGISIADADGAPFNAFETDLALGADVKLKVGDSVFYANNGYLSVVSSVFRDMFAFTAAAGPEQSKKEMKEVELKGLDASDF